MLQNAFILDDRLIAHFLSLSTEHNCGPQRCVRCSVPPSSGPFVPHVGTTGPGGENGDTPGWCGRSGGAGSEKAGANQYVTGGCSQSGGEQTVTGGQCGRVRTTDLCCHMLHIQCMEHIFM